MAVMVRRVSIRLLFLIICAIACSATAGSAIAARASPLEAAGAHARRLMAPTAKDSAQTAHQCMWNAAAKSCEADDAVNIMYSVQGQPISAYLWFLLMTHDRQHECDTYTSRNACSSDKKNNCVWLDDVLAEKDSSKSKKQSSTGKKAAERSSTIRGMASNLFTERMATLQQEFGAALREQLARLETPILDPAMELMAAQPTQQQQGTAAAATPPASPTSNSKSSGSSSSSTKGSKAKSSQQGSRKVMCTSHELLENFVFTRSGYSSLLQAPLAMHCPGSKAYNLVKCMRQTSTAACSATPGCVVVPRVGSKGSQVDLCVSSHFNSLSKDDMKKFMFDLTLAEPAVVGSCDGACWMRQAMLCNHTTGAESCSALSFCRSMGPSCVPRLYSQDNFGSSVQEYLGECAEVDNRKDCEALQLKLVKKGAYGSWRMPQTASSKCAVGSITGVLGRTRVMQEGTARTEMLTAIGAEEEKAATAGAANTAAADAAKAARIMSERGVTGLQQLYASVSSALG